MTRALDDLRTLARLSVLALATSCVVAATAACTSDPEPSRALAAEAAELRCDESHPAQPPPDGQAVVEGVVLAPISSPEPTGDALLFAKGGLWVQGETAVRISVVRPGVLVGWGSPARPARRIEGSPCPGPQWRVWAGGVFLREAACVTLSVRTADQRVEVDVAVGASCG